MDFVDPDGKHFLLSIDRTETRRVDKFFSFFFKNKTKHETFLTSVNKESRNL